MRYLIEGLGTVTAQHAVFREVEWLRQQDASSLGVLHGILVDKLIRLLEALEAGPLEAGPQ